MRYNGLMDHSMELLANRDVHIIIIQAIETCLDYPRLSFVPHFRFGSWPQREGLLSPTASQIHRRNFPPVGFYPIMNGFTDAPSIKPDHATWNVTWTVLFQIQSFSGRFIFLHLSTSPRSDFPGSHGVKKNINELVLFQTRALQSFDIFYVSFHGIWKPCNEPETSGEWAHKCHKMAPVFHIEHSFIYFLLSEFFCYLFVLTNFDSSRWYTHTTTPATGT